jgi:hypothetical protein
MFEPNLFGDVAGLPCASGGIVQKSPGRRTAETLALNSCGARHGMYTRLQQISIFKPVANLILRQGAGAF